VAFSGGRDSTALLHATARSALALGIGVVALHVHHGLSAAADAWLRHCETLCARWTRRGLPVRFAATRLATRPGRGDSVEAWARRERYRALRAMALEQGAELVLLAHHRRDQAETFVLQALRAGGVAALSAMPASARREGITWARPWLSHPAESVAAYARRHRLPHVEDDTNADLHLARNRLRARVWPALLDAFPEAEAALACAAAQARTATFAMQEWAGIDLAAIASERGFDIAAWRALPDARRAPALQAWLRARIGGKAASRSLVDRLVAELDPGKPRRWQVPGGELRSYRGELRHVVLAPSMTSDTSANAGAVATPAPACIDLRKAGVHRVPAWRGAFVVERLAAGGLPMSMAASLELRSRRPDDRFQAGPGRPPRSLKLQYQAAGVPAWLRAGPIVSHQGVPVFVPGLGADARAVSARRAPCVGITWQPD